MNQETQLVSRMKEELDLVMLCRFGSHLYGTNTPDSDTDYKGVYMPTAEQMMLQNVPKSVSFNSKTSREEGEKNSVDDVDCEVYSLHYFVELALKGETAALDMLHCNAENLLQTSQCWQDMVAHREYFYTRSLKSFVGYARKQAAKYGMKGSRLATANKILTLLDNYPGHSKLRDTDLFKRLPLDENCHMLKSDTVSFPTYQWCGKQVQNTVRVDYFREMVVQFIDQFGKRAKLAEKNEGVDWKAMSHALRAAYQVEEILTTDNLVYPLKCADYLVEVKKGKLPFKNVLAALEDLMQRVEALSEMSRLPEKADRRFWKEWLKEWLVTEMCLCEQKHVILKPYRLYSFWVDSSCRACQELERAGK